MLGRCVELKNLAGFHNPDKKVHNLCYLNAALESLRACGIGPECIDEPSSCHEEQKRLRCTAHDHHWNVLRPLLHKGPLPSTTPKENGPVYEREGGCGCAIAYNLKVALRPELPGIRGKGYKLGSSVDPLDKLCVPSPRPPAARAGLGSRPSGLQTHQERKLRLVLPSL